MIIFNRLPDSSRSCRKQTKRPTAVQKYHRLTVPTRVEFLFLPQAQRVPLRQPEHMRSHQKIDTHGSNDHACHRGCNSSFDDRLVHNNSTCLRFHNLCRLCQNSCHCCSRGLTCQQISHVVPRFLVSSLPQQAHVDITVPTSIGVGWLPESTVVRQLLSRFVGHVDASVVPEIVPWPCPDKQS